MSSPAAPVCLIHAFSERADQRGGTLIAEFVTDRDEHLSRLADPDGYRPESCPHCDHHRLHAHDFRERKIRHQGVATFRRYRCALCRAVWMVLAGFVARHLHRCWAFVQAAMTQRGLLEGEPPQPKEVEVPERTLQRWTCRLETSAEVVVAAFSESGVDLGQAAKAKSRVELVGSMIRERLVSPARALAELAGWLHRISPGLRVM